MTAGSRSSRRREGWPWESATTAARAGRVVHDAEELARADALVAATALSVAQLTEELRLALRRLQEAQHEARVVAECAASREAGSLIERVRRHE